MPKDGKVSEKRKDVALREQRVLELARAGYTDQEIADQLDLNRTTVTKMRNRVVERRLSTDVEAWKQLHVERCEGIIQGAWAGARRGDDKSAKTVLKALGHEARILGLEAPKEIKGNLGGGGASEIAAMLLGAETAFRMQEEKSAQET